MIKLLIVDDQLTVREKLKVVLDRQHDFEVVGTAANGDEALMQVELLSPDVVLMDIE
jgi:hemolysin D